MSMYPLFIIILNWNLPDDTITCITSVQRSLEHLAGKVEIVLVDNGSTDDSVQRIQAHFGQAVQVIETGKNLGFAGGMNAGIRHAVQNGANAVLLLNNDTVVDAEMIAQLVATAQNQPSAGLVGPVIYYHDQPQRIWRYGDDEHPWLPFPLMLKAADLAAAHGQPLRVDYVTGCCMLIRRSVVEQVGLFDERYFMYFEDADYCRRVRDAGYEVWCAPQACMWHKVSLSAAKDRPANRYARLWGCVQFYRQHPHGRFPATMHLYIFLKLLKTTALDAGQGDWALIVPSWRAIFDSYGNRNRLKS